MKKILIGIIILCFPILVNAETCSGIGTDTYCNASSSNCLSSLQENYNTWNTSEKHSGTSCIKVIAKYECSGGKYQSKTYLSGYNPNQNFLCSDGSVASNSNMTLRGYAAADADVVGDSCTSTLYIPEAWEITCGSSSNTSNNNSNSSNSTNNGNVSSGDTTNNNSGDVGNSNISGDTSNSGTTNNVGVNSNGQITGTTESKDTGVETYFIVLMVLVLVAYLMLLLSKKKNLFKSI